MWCGNEDNFGNRHFCYKCNAPRDQAGVDRLLPKGKERGEAAVLGGTKVYCSTFLSELSTDVSANSG